MPFLVVLSLLTVSTGTALAASDITRPVVHAFSLSPTAVDTTAGPQVVIATATITDDLSGVKTATVSIANPSGLEGTTADFTHTTGNQFTASIIIPRYAENGTWSASWINFSDWTGNSGTLILAELDPPGTNTTFDVTGLSDSTPPVLHSLTLNRNSVDTTNAPQIVIATATITDDLSGVVSPSTNVVSPVVSNIRGTTAHFTHTTGAQYEAVITIPRYSENGPWTVLDFSLSDRAGNFTHVSLGDMDPTGMNRTIVVSGVEDLDPPLMHSLDLSRTAVFTSRESQLVTADAIITDDLSGFREAWLQISSPSETQQVTANFSHTTGNHYTASIIIPRYAESGTWTIWFIYLQDKAGTPAYRSGPGDFPVGSDSTIIVNSDDDVSPTVVGTPDRAPNANGWYRSNVTINWSATEPSPSSGTPTDPPNTVASTEGANVLYTSAPSCDPAGNCATGSRSLSIDKTKPTLAPTVNPGEVLLGGTVSIAANGADPLSGIASQSCGAGTTTTVGTKSVNCWATDRAGNNTTVAKTYAVRYRWDGFLQPINDLAFSPSSTESRFRLGSTVQVMFKLKRANGTSVQASAAPTFSRSGNRGACDSITTLEAVNNATGTFGSAFRWTSSTGSYFYNWRTTGLTAGEYRITASLNDGTQRTVDVCLRP